MRVGVHVGVRVGVRVGVHVGVRVGANRARVGTGYAQSPRSG